ncbi:hypothetical protein OIV83_005900 [Microbotryomycetes sp. JL201]|nr:hypothetical protein OIV83_005900 [Microbotryomycetes sp. JL201]
MVYYYSSTASSQLVTLYAGVDKFENEDLIKHAPATDVWVHIDKLSSPHVYVRVPSELKDKWTYKTLPQEVQMDAAQLVKAGSIAGNKKDNVTMLFTQTSNLLKDNSMSTGAVSFHNPQLVYRLHVETRENPVVNRLNKTKRNVTLQQFIEDVQEMEKLEARKKKIEANERKNAELQLARQRQAEAKAREYSILSKPSGTTEEDEDAEWQRKQKVGDFDPDEDFM